MLNSSRAKHGSRMKRLPASWLPQQKAHQPAWLPPSLRTKTGFSRDTTADAAV